MKGNNRSDWPKELNLLGVQNRFLLQANNFSFASNYHCLAKALFRNILVIGGVIAKETSSIAAFKNLFSLKSKLLSKRKQIASKDRVDLSSLRKWFSDIPYSEPALLSNKSTESSKPFRIETAIVAFRAGQEINILVDSLLEAKKNLPAHINLSINIVENGGSAIKNRKEIRIFNEGKNLGFSGAINHVVSELNKVSTEYDGLLVLNPDIELSASSIESLVEALVQNNQLGAISPILINSDESPQLGFTARRDRSLMATIAELIFLHKLWPTNPWTKELQYQDDRQVTSYISQTTPDSNQPYEPDRAPLIVEQPAGACVLIRKQAFQELAGFDEQFWPAWFEDVDFFKRLKKSNWLSAVTSLAKAKHAGGKTLSVLRGQDFARAWYGNMCRFSKKHYGDIGHVVFRVFFTVGLAFRGAVSLFNAYFSKDKSEAFKLDKLDYAKTLFKLLIDPESENKKFATDSGSTSSLRESSLREKITLEIIPPLGSDKQNLPIETENKNWRVHFSSQLTGHGLELGPLHRPCPTHEDMKVDYVDRMTVAELREHYPELKELPLVEPDILDDAESLKSVSSGAYDFVVAAHIIEHTKNPIDSVKNWFRVLKPGGKLYLIVPDKRNTFDKTRVRTSLEHLILDYKRPSDERDYEHYVDYATNVTGKSGSEALEEAKDLIERDYSIHYHVFTPDDMTGMLNWFSENVEKLEILSGPCQVQGSDEFHYLISRV